MIRKRPQKYRRLLHWLPALLAVAVCSGAAHASAPTSMALASWSDWWLNPNYAEHGKSVDQIFYFIFWLTSVIMVVVEILLVWFMIKYRRRAGAKKAVYLHGNTRLEMIWTLIPAIILIVLALWTKRVWDNYRYSPIADDPNRLKVLVIGEQFKWNVIYPGPRGKIGRFLVYPKTTDLRWPVIPPNKAGQFKDFPNVPGPAFLPEEQARKLLNSYIAEINPLGRDYSDPDTDPLLPADRIRLDQLRDGVSGREARLAEVQAQVSNLPDEIERMEGRLQQLKAKKSRGALKPNEQKQLETFPNLIEDDKKKLETAPAELEKLKRDAEDFKKLSEIESLNDYSNANGRPLVIPKGRPIEIQISSRDVIHDFFLPNFRVRLDTVPGMRGKLYLTATQSAKEVGGGARDYSLAELQTLLGKVGAQDMITAIINEKSPGARPPGDMVEGHKDPYWRYATKDGDTIIHDGFPVDQKTIDALRAAGVAKLTAIVPYYWDIVCEELCGAGHSQMQGKLIVVDKEELRQGDYKNFYP